VKEGGARVARAHREPVRFPAVLGPVLAQRGLAAGLALACAAQVALTALGLPGWPCPFRQATGLPCPGCGLSRAVAALMRGDWGQAMASHAFAPLAAAAAVALAVAALLPGDARRRLAAGVEAVERKTGLSLVLGAGTVLYWLARFLYTPLAPFTGR
jgi:Protein of unknown function (DUF2752)